MLTREPGGTAVGERIRALLLDPGLGELGAVSELLLMAAARAEHVRTVIRPALDAGRDVVTDRFSGSSLAYQGYGRGLDLDLVRSISGAATGGLEPDVTILLVVPPELAGSRRCGAPDRIEAAEPGFHERVLAGFDRLAQDEGWLQVDGTGTPAEVAERVLVQLEERWPAR